MALERVVPGAGQESVWDYPRPPSLEQTGRHVVVELGGVVIADTVRAWRVCETSHPPVYYVPREDIVDGVLRPSAGGSFCEWKGMASYWTVDAGGVCEPDAGWSYESPSARFVPMTGAVSFYPARMDRCLVDGEVVRPQAGGFYGGWITDEVVGPFKGEPGDAPLVTPHAGRTARIWCDGPHESRRRTLRLSCEAPSEARKRGGRRGARVLDWWDQRKEVVQHMSESSYGTLEVVGR